MTYQIKDNSGETWDEVFATKEDARQEIITAFYYDHDGDEARLEFESLSLEEMCEQAELELITA